MAKHACATCGDERKYQIDLPDDMTYYLFEKHATFTDDMRARIHQWESGNKTLEKLIQLMLRLDRPGDIVAKSLSQGHSGAR